tara:strand:+ start:173 stop:376 length:204 start_codon:yes stop_codon:yes gene_type:complete
VRVRCARNEVELTIQARGLLFAAADRGTEQLENDFHCFLVNTLAFFGQFVVHVQPQPALTEKCCAPP